jgi:glycogen debranching enzyme
LYLFFDADAPHHPRGCVAQAWGVAEVLRVMKGYKLYTTIQKIRPQRKTIAGYFFT